MVKKIGDFEEKPFIKEILSDYATTAVKEEFDDCVIIDLSSLCSKDLPFLVYSLDHPSFIKRPLPEELKYRFYGRWTASIVCGDILAMGAKPRGFSLDFSVPIGFEIKKIRYILEGIRDILDEYGAEYQGGNLDINNLELVGFAWGTVERDKIIRRSGACAGDFIAVTTTIGYGWADYLSRKLERTEILSEATSSAFKEYKLFPIAPHQAILAAVETGGITSGMDLSDGLIEFLYTIKERNGLGCRIFESSLIITPEMKEVADKVCKISPALLALEPGYDTPLGHAYTVMPEKWEDVFGAFKRNGATLYKIGVVEPGEDILLERANSKLVAIPPFWDDQCTKSSLVSRWFDLIKQMDG